MKRWIVVINKIEARFFSASNPQATDIKYIDKLENPKGRLRSGEINADKPGFFSSGSSTHGGHMTSVQSPTDRVAEVFAKEIVQYLEHALSLNQFAELTLIVEPRFLGKIRAVMGKELSSRVVKEIPKDLRQVSTEQVRQRL